MNIIPKYFKFCISYKQQKITVANRQQSNLFNKRWMIMDMKEKLNIWKFS